MTPAEIATWLLIVGVVGAIVTGLFMVASRWAIRRESERTAAATFEHDFIPEAADVLHAQEAIKLAETQAVIEEIVVRLVDMKAHVERLRRGAA
jgi:uncharacterized membrane protein YbaN (DUF454 family)